VDYVIPANDDAIRAIKLIVEAMANAALEGLALRKGVDVSEITNAASAQTSLETGEVVLATDDSALRSFDPGAEDEEDGRR
jgi:small subunit ribosomal protein S2